MDEVPYADEEEGEQFEFDDSGDEFPEADRTPHAPPAPDYGGKAQINGVAPHPQQEGPDPRPSNPEPTAAAAADTDTVAAEPPVPVAMATTDTVASAPDPSVANAPTETTAPVAAAEGDKTSSVPAGADRDLPPPPPPEDSTPVGTDSVNTS